MVFQLHNLISLLVSVAILQNVSYQVQAHFQCGDQRRIGVIIGQDIHHILILTQAVRHLSIIHVMIQTDVVDEEEVHHVVMALCKLIVVSNVIQVVDISSDVILFVNLQQQR